MKNFYRLSRLTHYLWLILFLTISLIWLISPQNLFSSKTIIVLLADIFLTGFGFSFNDIEDAEDDYYILEKRKRNPISSGNLTKKQGYVFSFLLLLTGLSLLLLINYLVFFIGVILAFVEFFYSWKNVRLKSIPVVDLVSHAIGFGFIQFLITYLIFRPLDLLVIPFLLIIISFSLIGDICQELKDFNVDKKTKIKNTIQKMGKSKIKKLLITTTLIIIVGSIAVIFTFQSIYSIIFLISLNIVIITFVKRNLSSYCSC